MDERHLHTQRQRPEDRLKAARKPRKSILDVAIALQDKEFIAHSSCTNVIEHFWRGKSARCGKVMLRSDRGNDPVAITFNRDASILVQVLLLLLFLPITLVIDALSWLLSTAQTLGGGQTDEDGNAGTGAESSSDPTSVLPRLLPTTINEYYPWSQWSCPDDEAEIRITPIVESIQIFHIPYVKRILYITCHVGFTILFAIVSFQPFCEPLNGTHYTFGYWTLARLWHQCHHYFLRNSAQQRWYRHGGTTLVDLVATALLLAAGYLRVSLDPEIFSSPICGQSLLVWTTAFSASTHAAGRRSTRPCVSHWPLLPLPSLHAVPSSSSSPSTRARAYSSSVQCP